MYSRVVSALLVGLVAAVSATDAPGENGGEQEWQSATRKAPTDQDQLSCRPFPAPNIVARQQNLPTATEGAGYLPSPIAQPSVATTQFNPNIQNPGGTTNSAGTFDVVSLSRSSSFNFDQGGSLAQTTTFQAGSPNFASQQGVAASYPAGQSSAGRQQAAGTSALPSLTGSSSASVIASGNDNSSPAKLLPSGIALPALAVVVAAVAGAGWVM